MRLQLKPLSGLSVSNVEELDMQFLLIRTIYKTAVVPIPTTAHRPFIELPWGDC